MNNYLWKIDKEKLNKTNLIKYSNFIEKNYKINFENNFNKIWEWSIANQEFFWKSIWDFTKVLGNPGKKFLQKSEVFFKNKFFPEAKLNYAQNLLVKNNSQPSIIFKSENGYRNTLSWRDLNLAKFLIG